MNDDVTAVTGIEVGHADDPEGLTGCTVVLCREGAVVGVDVRGLAPGTRETDLCKPGTLVERAHGILLTGGSAFGLDAASGVMRYLWERGVGFDAGITRVPIVPGAVIFDLGLGSMAWPGGAMGYAACQAAGTGPVRQGCVGAGMGASVGKALGMAHATKSGLGTASQRSGDAIVAALMVVNAFGDVVLPDRSEILAGPRNPADGSFLDTVRLLQSGQGGPGSPEVNSTIGVIATDAALTPDAAAHLASIAHDGLARSIRPVHTLLDGDTIFALATGAVPMDRASASLQLDVAAVQVVERAVVNAIRHARALGGLPAAGA